MLPLKGVKVLDLTTINGFAAMELADYGAEVIKVERPKFGDSVRSYPPFKNDISLYHVFMDRGKKSITLNLKSEEGKEILKKLVGKVDILIENFKVGTMEKMGLGYETLSKINPKLVYGALTSFGEKGPEKDYIAYDIAVQAKSGIMDITGFPNGEPTKVGAYIGDHYSCTYLVSAVCMALYHARATGIGQKVETSMFASLLSVVEDKISICDTSGCASRTGNAHPSINPYDVIKCKDGYVALGISTDAQWEKFCKEFGKEDWLIDEKYKNNEQRGLHYFGDLRDKLENYLVANFKKIDVEKKCSKIKVPGCGVKTLDEAMEQEQLKIRKMIAPINDQRIGKINMIGKIIKFHGSEKEQEFKTAPVLGQNNKEIYSKFMTTEKISELEEKNVI